MDKFYVSNRAKELAAKAIDGENERAALAYLLERYGDERCAIERPITAAEYWRKGQEALITLPARTAPTEAVGAARPQPSGDARLAMAVRQPARRHAEERPKGDADKGGQRRQPLGPRTRHMGAIAGRGDDPDP